MRNERLVPNPRREKRLSLLLSRSLRKAFVLAAAAGVLLLEPTGCGKAPSGDSARPAAVKIKYSCPMHPTVIDDKPSDCPICGMRLEALDSGAGSSKASITISTEMRQLMGVTLGKVEKRPLRVTLRTSARITPDETRLFRVTTKVGGWIEKLNVSVTGQPVARGEPLLSIYSQELLSSEQEYLSAQKAFNDLPKDSSDIVVEGARSVLAATRRRLQLWDIGDEQIAQLEKSGQPEKAMILKAPANGVVMEKNIMAGQKIMPGDSLMVIADLSSVWADADIHEADIGYARTGMPVEITLPSFPGKVFSGKISFISPGLDPETRTVKARMEIPNADLLLKPEMFGTAILTSSLGEKLAVPEQAIMRSGIRATAFKDGGEGKLIPVEVTLGPLADGYYEVLSGLTDGDKVVTSANFLIDSESSRRAALEAMDGQGAVRQNNGKK